MRDAWVETAQVINVALTAFAAIAGRDRELQHGLRAIRRSTEALGRRVAG